MSIWHFQLSNTIFAWLKDFVICTYMIRLYYNIFSIAEIRNIMMSVSVNNYYNACFLEL